MLIIMEVGFLLLGCKLFYLYLLFCCPTDEVKSNWQDTLNFLNIRTPQTNVVITLKFELP